MEILETDSNVCMNEMKLNFFVNLTFFIPLQFTATQNRKDNCPTIIRQLCCILNALPLKIFAINSIEALLENLNSKWL